VIFDRGWDAELSDKRSITEPMARLCALILGTPTKCVRSAVTKLLPRIGYAGLLVTLQRALNVSACFEHKYKGAAQVTA